MISKDGFPYNRSVPRAEDADDKNYSAFYRTNLQRKGVKYVDPLEEHRYKKLPVTDEERDGFHGAVDLYFTSPDALLRGKSNLLLRNTGVTPSGPQVDEEEEKERHRLPRPRSHDDDLDRGRSTVDPGRDRDGRGRRDGKSEATAEETEREKLRDKLPKQLWKDPFHYVGRGSQLYGKISNHAYVREMMLGLVPLGVKSSNGLDSDDPFRSKRYYVNLCGDLGIRPSEESHGTTFCLLTFVFYDNSDKELVENNDNIAGPNQKYDIDRDVESLKKDEDVNAFIEERMKVRILFYKKITATATTTTTTTEETANEGDEEKDEENLKFDCFYLTCN